MRIELYGTARLHAGTGALDVRAETLGEALIALGAIVPTLAGTVLDGPRLRPHYKLSVNGDRFVSDPACALNEGDCLLILSADSGG